MVIENPKAFPTSASDGMSLRDYFAAKAMQAYISADYDKPFLALSKEIGATTTDLIAKASYQLADAMLFGRVRRNA